MGSARRFVAPLTLLMVVQASVGLMLPDQYRDVDWIRATWHGNDWITLTAAVPLLWLGHLHAIRGSLGGQLLVLGVAGYGAYNYAFYLFGAALNVFFPLYVVGCLLASATLGYLLSHFDPRVIAASTLATTRMRWIGGYLVFVAVGLALVWLGLWGMYAFAGRPTPIEPEAFKVVAALDLSVMVPALLVGGVLLWRHSPWGYVIATLAAIQGALYLLVLSVNSAVAIGRGSAEPPGELPIWGSLMVFTAVAAVLLVKNASGSSTSR
jgi:hypothetical protein